MRTIVLDTNCLLAALPSISPYHKVWIDIINGAASLCVSNDILEEYEEILSLKTTSAIAEAVIAAILEAPKTRKVEPTFFYNLISKRSAEICRPLSDFRGLYPLTRSLHYIPFATPAAPELPIPHTSNILRMPASCKRMLHPALRGAR